MISKEKMIFQQQKIPYVAFQWPLLPCFIKCKFTSTLIILAFIEILSKSVNKVIFNYLRLQISFLRVDSTHNFIIYIFIEQNFFIEQESKKTLIFQHIFCKIYV